MAKIKNSELTSVGKEMKELELSVTVDEEGKQCKHLGKYLKCSICDPTITHLHSYLRKVKAYVYT
jgi:hypothetical protein